MYTSTINRRRFVRNEIRAYEQKKYLNSCIESFSLTDKRIEKHRYLESPVDYNAKAQKAQTDSASSNKPFDKLFLNKIIISVLLAFIFLVCSVFIKSSIFLKQQEYSSLVSKTEIIQSENQVNEYKYISSTSGPEFLQKIKDLGMVKNEHYICVNSNKVKEDRNK